MAKQLISPEEIENIKGVLGDVTFTFFKEPIKLYRWKESLNRWNEDRDNTAKYDIYDLKGLVEFGSLQSDAAQDTPTGRVDDQSVKVSFNFRDLKELGLTKDNSTTINTAVDYFMYEGVQYTVDSAITDGFFDEEPVLVIVSGKRIEQKT